MNNFKQHLSTQALEICGEEDRFRGDKINIASLQISAHLQNTENLDKSGHFHYRKDIVSVYSNSPSATIPYNKIFEEAVHRAKLSVKNCSTPEAKSKHILKYGNLAFIFGQAGMGKTTLSKFLVQQMLDPDVRLYGAEFVFFIKFRDLDYRNDMDLLQFFTTSAQFLLNITNEDRKSILLELETNENVYIVMDGLDEAILDPSMKYPNCDAMALATAATFIYNLLSGRLLPQAKKIITSRPRQLAHLSDGFSSNLYLNLLGLNDDGQRQICCDLCGDDIARQNKILSLINSRPDLKSLCYVPIACIMVVRLYTTDSLRINVNTVTAILITALEEWFLKKLKGNFQIKEISFIAYEGFMSNRFYFCERHLRTINFENTTTFFTNIIHFQLLQGKPKTYFAHLVWQEFFVALKLRFFTTKDEFAKTLFPQLKSDRFEVVARFLYGLCNRHVLDMLLDCVEIEALNTQCKEMLITFVLEELKKHRDAEIDPHKSNAYFGSILPVLGWVREMEDTDFTEQAATSLKNEIEINSQVLASDIPSINHVLCSRHTDLVLLITNPRFVGNCSPYFYEKLHYTINENPNIRVSLKHKNS